MINLLPISLRCRCMERGAREKKRRGGELGREGEGEQYSIWQLLSLEATLQSSGPYIYDKIGIFNTSSI